MDEKQMDVQQLSATLESIADEVEVSPVPLRTIKASQRPRWRGPMLVAASVVVVAGAAFGATAGVQWWQDGQRVTSLGGEITLTPDTSEPDVLPTPGTAAAPSSGAASRLVGIGEVALEVPRDWTTNDTRCGTPQSNTVVIDTTDRCDAVMPRPEGVESIEVQPLQAVVDLVGEPVREETLLGVPAVRWDTECHESAPPINGARYCRASVWLQGDLDVRFSATAATAERADELLSTITRMKGQVGLMGPADFARFDLRMSEKSDTEVADAYVAHLRGQGLAVSFGTERGPQDPATTIRVSPEPGTVLPRGARVEVTLGPPSD